MESSGAQDLCVLIAHDDPVERATLSALLEAEGMNVVAVPTALRAHVAIHRAKPSVVLLAIALPGGATEALLDALAVSPVAVPGVVLLGADEPRLASTATAYAVPMLRRPFDRNLLAATVRVAAEQRIRPCRQQRGA